MRRVYIAGTPPADWVAEADALTRQLIADYKGAKGPQALRLFGQAIAIKTLKEMVDYSAEFSSVAEACIRKNAPEPLIASVFER